MKTQTKAPQAREAEIQRNGMALLAALGWRAFRRNTGAVRTTYRGRERLVRFGEKGMADLWAVVPSGPNAGSHAEIEIKRPGEWPTPAQIAWLESMNGVGGSVAFWVSNLEDLDDVAHHVMAGGRIRFEAGGTGRYELVA